MLIKQQILVPIEFILPSNTKLSLENVEYLKSEWSAEKCGALPGALAVTSLKKPVNAGDFFIHITDGNHRLQALKEMGYTHAPVILLYPEEYQQIAQQKIGIDYLVQRTGYILTDRTKLTSSIFIQKWLTNQLKW